MIIELIMVGKTDSTEISNLVNMYLKRINRYIKFSLVTIPDIRSSRNLSEESLKKEEGTLILKNISEGDYVVLLDDKGNEYRSSEFALWLQKRMNSGIKKLIFIIGGAYGFAPEVRSRANDSVSLSRMTFSHQIVRAIFTEQLYRAFSILNNEPYHHE